MPDPERLLNTLRRAAAACRATPGRIGRIVRLGDCAEVIVAGDLHGNVDNLKSLLQVAELGRDARRHLVLQELIHGTARYPQGGDRSHQLLDLFAALKCQFPHRVHLLLGNHELAQWTEKSILKGDDDQLKLFDRGVRAAYGDHADEVLDCYDELLALTPVALRTENGIYLSHSLPSAVRMDQFHPASLEQDEPPPEEFRGGGSIFALLWGRDCSEENVQAFLERVSARLLITGHIPSDRGCEVPNSRQLILDAEGTPGCFCRFRAQGTITLGDLIGGIGLL